MKMHQAAACENVVTVKPTRWKHYEWRE